MKKTLEALNQELEKTERKLRWAEQEEKRLEHQAKALTRKRRPSCSALSFRLNVVARASA